MKTMQVYWVEAQPSVKQATPGQFVHMNNKINVVCGFINEVDQAGGRVQICMFKPIEAKAFAEIVHEKISTSDMLGKLKRILDADDKLRNMWLQVMRNGPARN